MPTYEYLCTSCGHEWEFEQSIKDEPQKLCQKCNQATARRQISRGTGFILKGGGWYSDLYSSSSNKAPSKDGTGESKSESKSEPTSESKSESSAGTKTSGESKSEGSSGTTSKSTSTVAAA
jgi:putative FmdB family regulatory protein